MALTVENGGGVRGANTYQLVAGVTAYLTARNRQTENNWESLDQAVQEAACVAATDYIDRRFGPKFKGRRAVELEGSAATATVTLSGVPDEGDTVTVAGVQVTLTATAATPAQAQIGADADATATNLAAALAGVGAGVTAAAEGAAVTISSAVQGLAGNDITLEVSGTSLASTTFSGGLDGGDQPLEFPRTGLRRPDGRAVEGIPRELLAAHAEYAVRAVLGALEADPTVPVAGQGPLTELSVRVEGAVQRTQKWATPDQSSGAVVIEPYPAADQLLADFVRGADLFGRVGRA